MLWRRKRDFAWDQMIKIVEIIKVKLVEIETEIDMIKRKLRSKSPLTEKEVSEGPESENLIDDGLNELRKLYKPEKE